jgi:AcrR family transcriptional regulator
MRTPRSSWIEQGLVALGAGGPDAVRVEPLAEALGVTKGGFYGQFADRGDLLEAVLDTWERESTDDVTELVRGADLDVRARIRRAGVMTFSSDRLRPVDLAVRDWARRDAAVAERLRRVDNRRMQFLREQFGTLYDDELEIEARSVLAFCVAIGVEFLAAELQGGTQSEVLRAVMRVIEDG